MTISDANYEMYKITLSKCMSSESREAAEILRNFLTEIAPLLKMNWEGDANEEFSKYFDRKPFSTQG